MSNITIGKILSFLLLILILGGIVVTYFSHTYIRAEFKKNGPDAGKNGGYIIRVIN